MEKNQKKLITEIDNPSANNCKTLGTKAWSKPTLHNMSTPKSTKGKPAGPIETFGSAAS